jgi:hypothetical protein
MIKRRIDPLRFSVATTLLSGCCGAILLCVRASADSTYAVPIGVVAGVAFTLIPASVFEWLVHRYVYHRRGFGPLTQIFRIHHKGHHSAIFPTWRYTTNGEVRRHPVLEPNVSRLYPAGWLNLVSKVAHFGFYMALGFAVIWTPARLVTSSSAFLVTIVVSLAIISDLFVRVHDAIHYPGQFRFVEAQPWFPFIDRHHFIHHVDTEANVNFLLPLADWCYGTLRMTLTDAEVAKHGTLQEAKSSPLGFSEPAALFAARRAGRTGAGQPKTPGFDGVLDKAPWLS